MRIEYLLAIVLVLLVACKNKNESKDILSREKMMPLVYDLMLSEEFVSNLAQRDTTYKGSVERFKKYEQVFNLHHTDHKTFAKSYNYYLGRPDELKVIFDSV